MPTAKVFDSQFEEDYLRRKEEESSGSLRRLESRGERDGTYGITWYQTLSPCHKDPYVRNEADTAAVAAS